VAGTFRTVTVLPLVGRRRVGEARRAERKGTPVQQAPDPRHLLAELVDRAALLPTTDADWCSLTVHAAAVTGELAAVGALPDAFAVELHDPSVVVARTLAAAQRHVAKVREGAAAASVC
jgi:hypothetical protein